MPSIPLRDPERVCGGRVLSISTSATDSRFDFLLRCLGLQGDIEQKADACMLGFLWSVDSAARQALLRAVADKVDAADLVRHARLRQLDHRPPL